MKLTKKEKMNLTDKQMIHRAYLASPLWARKRIEALEYYGAVCARCKCHGSDVHHKTYDRTGGNELMSDLEVLCRPCHETHHRVERVVRKPSKGKGEPRSVNAKALFGYLTEHQKSLLLDEFHISRSTLYSQLTWGSNPPLTKAALCLIGVSRCHGFSKIKLKKHTAPKNYRS